MEPDDPRHGQPSGAIAHWRAEQPVCQPCRAAERRARKRRNLDRARGNPRTVPLGDAWHILAATRARKQIADATGISSHHLASYYKAGPKKLVHRTTRDKILAVRITWTPIGIQRRLQALSALGYSMLRISQTTGVHVDGLKRLRRRDNPVFVREEVAHAIIATYDNLSMTMPAEDRSTNRTLVDARRAGYHPPFSWDDIDNDVAPHCASPTANDYDEAVVLRILSGDPTFAAVATPPERRAVVSRWHGGHNELARLTGWKPERYYGDAA